jgi:Lysine-specific metallo-endopeptidase
MDNLEKLWAYIKEKAPPGGIPGHDDREYRDLKQYYDQKVSTWASGTDTEKQRARNLVYEPLKVCHVKPEGKELSLPGLSKKLAVAANLLAMSIVQNIDEATLRKERANLERLSISDLEASLKKILTKGDLVNSTRIRDLEFKNFASLPVSEGRRAQYMAAAEKAFERALDLLSITKCNLVNGIRPRFEGTFKAYFGDPDAKVEVGKLGFQGGAPPTLTGSPTRGAVVRAVLDGVWQGLRTRPVRLYFGGGTVIPKVKAYTNQKVRNQGRINIHLGYDFFTVHGEQPMKGVESSRAGVLIHELTHALAGTIDEGGAFSHHRCRQLAKFDCALTNAQSYACFVEDALG